MPDQDQAALPTRMFWVVGWVGLVWNALGIVTFLLTVTMSREAMESMPAAEQALLASVPTWVNVAYGVAVFGGTVACVLLLFRRAVAILAFSLSLAGIVLQMGHALFFTEMLQVRGNAGMILPMIIVVIAVYLLWFSVSARKRGWISCTAQGK
jgi:hypothetical protein